MSAPSPGRLAILAELGDPRGFTPREIASSYGLTLIGVERALHNMRLPGRKQVVFAAKTGHRTSRYFGRQEWADAYLAIKGGAYDPSFRAPRRQAWPRDLAPTFPAGFSITHIPHGRPYLLRTNTHSPF